MTDLMLAKTFYLQMLNLNESFESDLAAAKNKRGETAKIVHMLPRRARADYEGDPWDFEAEPDAALYWSSAIGIAMSIRDRLSVPTPATTQTAQ